MPFILIASAAHWRLYANVHSFRLCALPSLFADCFGRQRNAVQSQVTLRIRPRIPLLPPREMPRYPLLSWSYSLFPVC
jgi:hypothetical protein